MNRAVKIIINLLYIAATAAVVFLVCIALFGATTAANPDAMLPFSHREQAFLWLSFASVPVTLVAIGFYKQNDFPSQRYGQGKALLVFLPAFVCMGCAAFVIGVLVVSMANSFLLS